MLILSLVRVSLFSVLVFIILTLKGHSHALAVGETLVYHNSSVHTRTDVTVVVADRIAFKPQVGFFSFFLHSDQLFPHFSVTKFYNKARNANNQTSFCV